MNRLDPAHPPKVFWGTADGKSRVACNAPFRSSRARILWFVTLSWISPRNLRIRLSRSRPRFKLIPQNVEKFDRIGYFAPESRFVRLRHQLQRWNDCELSTDWGQLNGNSGAWIRFLWKSGGIWYDESSGRKIGWDLQGENGGNLCSGVLIFSIYQHNFNQLYICDRGKIYQIFCGKFHRKSRHFLFWNIFQICLSI